MTPEALAKSTSEHGHQRALFAWVNMAVRHGIKAAFDDACYEKGGLAYAMKWYGSQDALPILDELYAIPNGGERNKAVAAKLKAEGVKPGTPDTHFPVACGQYHSLYIEMKKPGGKVSPEQRDRIARLTANGNLVYVCYTWIEATGKLRYYLELGGYNNLNIGGFRNV
jgi:hypothetical protein